MDCLQYYYENPEDAIKYKINCGGKIYPNLNDVDKFNNRELLEFINKNYSGEAFPENSPFEFKPDYINLSNDQICKAVDISLGPQQKFMGQIMGPSSNFNNILIYHGLGSGKSCTSIVIGEALKNSSNHQLLYVVPAPLVDQYFEEIAGEIRNGKYFSCPSFCLTRNEGQAERDYYISQPQNSMLIAKMKKLQTETTKMYDINLEIENGDNTPATAKRFSDQHNMVKRFQSDLTKFQTSLKAKILRTFNIITHQTFIDCIYKTGENGQLIRGNKLLEDSALFRENGLLIIDEIQRLVSAGGIFYKKLYNAIKYYFHPKLRVALMSATPIYDNPYELALTINLLRPRIPFPLNLKDFYNFFIGKLNEKNECEVSDKKKPWISSDSCVINKDLISYICSGYVSYFKGGNPNAYPYKRIISLEHPFSPPHKTEYTQALKSDVSKDKNFKKNSEDIGAYESVLLGNYEGVGSEDNISGMYVTSQQYSNIFFPKIGENINRTPTEKKQALEIFRNNILKEKFTNTTEIINYVKTFSTKFASIVELTLNSNGPVFIFSNWLVFGVEPLAIIFEACGLTQFNDEDKGKGRYFIWSSETKTKDRTGTLIKRARNTFNSEENINGRLLKVILGTRSVMEGVSFKNVKQVHITEPWWNESRIEQILARASRFCSHSNLPYNEQYVDIYRHYSVLPSDGRDPEIVEMLTELGSNPDWQGLSTYGIDEKMLMASLKKRDINIELELVLKSCSVDCNINKNGNIIRLEENIIQLQSGMYQIYYKNPSNGRKYIREGIPDSVTFNDVYNRMYSFPNKDFPIKFTESFADETGFYQPYSDPEILEEPYINKDLNILENIKPWDSPQIFSQLSISAEIKKYMNDLYRKYLLLPEIRKIYFNNLPPKTLNPPPWINCSRPALTSIKENPTKRIHLINCIKQLAIQNLVSESVKKQINEEFNKETAKQKINSQVLELIYVHNYYPESLLEELLEIGINDPTSITEPLKILRKNKKK
jgi:hypothetical protein